MTVDLRHFTVPGLDMSSAVQCDGRCHVHPGPDCVPRTGPALNLPNFRSESEWDGREVCEDIS